MLMSLRRNSSEEVPVGGFVAKLPNGGREVGNIATSNGSEQSGGNHGRSMRDLGRGDR